MNNSGLTFVELTENLNYLKVIWNGKVIWSDLDNEIESDSDNCLQQLFKMQKEYANKKVYKMTVEVVEFHHCILTIEGEN